MSAKFCPTCGGVQWGATWLATAHPCTCRALSFVYILAFERFHQEQWARAIDLLNQAEQRKMTPMDADLEVTQ